MLRHIIPALGDDDGIKVLACLMLVRLTDLAPDQVVPCTYPVVRSR